MCHDPKYSLCIVFVLGNRVYTSLSRLFTDVWPVVYTKCNSGRVSQSEYRFFVDRIFVLFIYIDLFTKVSRVRITKYFFLWVETREWQSRSPRLMSFVLHFVLLTFIFCFIRPNYRLESPLLGRSVHSLYLSVLLVSLTFSLISYVQKTIFFVM